MHAGREHPLERWQGVGECCWAMGAVGGSLDDPLLFSPHLVQLSVTPALPQGIYPGVAPPPRSKCLQRAVGVEVPVPCSCSPAREVCSARHSGPGCPLWGWLCRSSVNHGCALNAEGLEAG